MQKSKAPTMYDVIACLQKSDVGTFKNFCADFGYSDDSIKARETYLAVQEEYAGFLKLCNGNEYMLTEATEIA
jgi:hypothetical protein